MTLAFLMPRSSVGDEQQSYSPQPAAASMGSIPLEDPPPSKLFDQLEVLSQTANRVCQKYWWLMAATFIYALIRLVLLRQPLPKVVACLLDGVAFLMDHMIEIVHVSAEQLRCLASELRREPLVLSNRNQNDISG
jgi:hypothetical protein